MWDQNSIQDLEARRNAAYAAGGAERVAKQHAQGKLTARERLIALFDTDTFVEVNTLVKSRATAFGMDKKRLVGDGVVCGYGKVAGRLVFASSQDFTVSGGSLGEAQAQKICRVMDMAYEMRAPFVSINDSGGARIEEGIDSLCGYGDIFFRNTRASGVIPQIAVILGPCAGGACYSPAICDFIFMTEGKGQMYITGPAVIKSVTGEDITVEELGGAAVHTRESGVAQFAYPDEASCFAGVKALLSYLPQAAGEPLPHYVSSREEMSRTLQEVIPDNMKKAYDVREVISKFVDTDSFFEVHKNFAQNICVGFARLDGDPIGIEANQPKVMGGSLDVNASDKAARFIRFCDAFSIPLLTLVDVPAFLPGRSQETAGIIRHGAKLLYAYSEATVPRVSLIMRKAYGGAYIAMDSKQIGADFVFAYPIAQIAVMGASGAAGIVFRKEISGAEDPEAKKAEKIAEYEREFMNPYIAAERGFVDEVIFPEETRRRIASAFATLKTKKVDAPRKKHGNIPL